MNGDPVERTYDVYDSFTLTPISSVQYTGKEKLFSADITMVVSLQQSGSMPWSDCLAGRPRCLSLNIKMMNH